MKNHFYKICIENWHFYFWLLMQEEDVRPCYIVGHVPPSYTAEKHHILLIGSTFPPPYT